MPPFYGEYTMSSQVTLNHDSYKFGHKLSKMLVLADKRVSLLKFWSFNRIGHVWRDVY